MFCSQCGTELPANSIFCIKCGKQIHGESQIEYSPVNNTLPQSRPLESVPQPQQIAKLTRRQISILSVWALLLFFGYADVLERIIDRAPGIGIGKDVIYLMFFTGWAFWYFWKARNRKGWIGGVVGVAVSILVIMLCAVIGGYARG